MAEEEAENVAARLGSFDGKVSLVSDHEEEIMILWAIQQPIFAKHNAFVKQTSLQLNIDACGRSLSILQSPSSLITPGVTGAVMWDSGIVLGKFLEHSVELGAVSLQGKKVVELGSGCGLVGCIAALLGAQVVLTDLSDRLKLLRKNIESNLYGDVRGLASVEELTWGDDLDTDLTDPSPDFVFGSDVVYSEGAVVDLVHTLTRLCGNCHFSWRASERYYLVCFLMIYFLSDLRRHGLLCNQSIDVVDAILEYFLEAAMKVFVVGRVDREQWHPDYCTSRVAVYVLVKK